MGIRASPNWGYHLEGPHNQDYSTLESILSPVLVREITMSSILSRSEAQGMSQASNALLRDVVRICDLQV